MGQWGKLPLLVVTRGSLVAARGSSSEPANPSLGLGVPEDQCPYVSSRRFYIGYMFTAMPYSFGAALLLYGVECAIRSGRQWEVGVL